MSRIDAVVFIDVGTATTTGGCVAVVAVICFPVPVGQRLYDVMARQFTGFTVSTAGARAPTSRPALAARTKPAAVMAVGFATSWGRCA